ncbi:LysR family transcriptional regulator [Rhizobium daejeonense]|uniref:HTH-type transcriptional regulator TtuA n=1 Tax=Rhizobium daejeonense TaxID=240521 RepID=A0A6M1RSC4_9HYPH|nr:LysR family transcriptional regulator [Rhizobium daejeonense]NGO64584.1 LysR family transcriptional regulator [Rhizobium daejeonense]
MDRLDCIRMFVAVMDTGSFAAGAARLGTSSSQASKLVSRLESDLGVQLIKRTTRVLSPTEAGTSYCERARALLEEFDQLDASVRNVSAAPSGLLRIAAPITFGTRQLAPLLNMFAEQYPDIQIDVSFSDRPVNLVEEGFDVAVRIGRPADSTLIACRLCPIRIVVIASPAYLAGHGTPTTPAELVDHACIVDTNFRDPLQWRFGKRDGDDVVSVSVQGRMRFSNAEACLSAAEAGLGIARVPSFVAGTALVAGNVHPLFPGMEDEPHGLYALYPPGRYLAAKVRVLVDFLADRFRGEPPWDLGWRVN